MPRRNRFEVPVEEVVGGGEVEVRKRNFWEDYDLSPEELGQAKRLLTVLGNLYWKEKEVEESVA